MTSAALALSLCPTCAAPVPAGGPTGHCPRCLWRVTSAATDDAAGDADAEPWLVLDDYELHEEIARRGMGVVYRARQRRLEREVAVKVLRGGELAGTEAQARFRSEAMAVARLRHPGIVAIHDVGEQDGVPWFSMDYVAGENLAAKVREHPLPAHAAAECVRHIAEAVQHAHEHGVLHRDLKPSNILLTSNGHPCVTDFGIARRLTADAAELTRTGQALGSPGYAAPEQAFGGAADPRTDVYGLGAVLYHVLTSRPPFQGPTADSILLQLRDSDPVTPRRLNPTVPRDLETICLQCLRKDPARRYATAAEVADDLARFLAGEPIRARPLGPIGRTLRWCRRRKKVAALLAFCGVLLIALVAGSLNFAHRHAQLEHRAVLLGEARAHRLAGVAGSRQLALTALRQAWDIKPSGELHAEAIACLALPDIQLARTLSRSDPQARPPAAGASADGRFALRFEKSALIAFERGDGREVARFEGFVARPIAQLDDTGSRLAIVQHNAAGQASDVVLYSLPSKQPLRTLDHPHPVRCLDWAGELIAVGGSSDRLIHIWDATSGRRLHRFNGHDAEIEAVRFRPHGQELVSGAQDSTVRVWHAGRGVELLRLEGLSEHTGPGWWAPDGAEFFLPVRDRAVVDVFRCTWPQAVQVLAPGADEPRSENLPSLTLNQTAALAAAVDETGCHVWSLRHGRVVAHFPKTGNEWMTTQFGDAAGLWLSGWNRALRRVPIEMSGDGWPHFLPVEPTGAGSGPLLVAARADGRAVALTNNKDAPAEDVVEVFLADEKRTIALRQVDPYCAALSPDGRWAVTGSFATTGAQLWSLPEGRAARKIEHSGVVLGAAFVENGATLWLWGDRSVQRLRTSDWTRLATIDTRLFPAFNVSPDGRFTASTSRTEVIVQRTPDFTEVLRLPVPAHAGRIGSATLVFSADGQHLALHTSVGSVVVWHLPTVRQELIALGIGDLVP